jgi:MinD-like ATPase involved in chromosome partitioning or flagellar assembly
VRIDIPDGSLCCGVSPESLKELGRGAVIFPAGEPFRNALLHEPESTPALVGESIPDVAPVNLISAIKVDCPGRTVYAVRGQEGSRVLDNALEAGADSVIDILETSAVGEIPTAFSAEMKVQSKFRGSSEEVGFEPREHKAICICFVSGRGGVGKSTLSVFMALAANKFGLRSALIDLDSQFGDLNFQCCEDPYFEAFGVCPGDLSVEGGLDFVPNGKIALVYSSARPEYSESVNDDLHRILRLAREKLDVVIVNTGANWTESLADAVEESDVTIFVMDGRVTSVRGAKSASELCMRMGIPSSKFLFAMNRYSPKALISSYDCALTIGVDEVLEVMDGGEAVGEAMSLGVPSSLIEDSNPMLASIDEMLTAILERFGVVVYVELAGKPGKVKQRRMPGRRRSKNVAARQGR